MNTYDFIFSNDPRHRVSRHLSFWLVFWVYQILTLFYPNFWFPEWKLQGNMGPVEKIGLFKFIQFTLAETLIGGISTYVFFIYPILYFILPRYLYKGRWLAAAISVLIWLVVTIFFGYYKQIWHYDALLSYFGLAAPGRPVSHKLYASAMNFFRNSPVIVGFAVGITLLKRWWLKQQEVEQIAKEKTKAELQLLKAGIHPHFLFNSLNNIYSFALESSGKASGMIQKLSGLLHYMINDCNQPRVTLGKELQMIEDYISLEKIRYGDRLELTVSILCRGEWMIAPLLFIPFVENSFKHGTSKMLEPSVIDLDIRMEATILYFKLRNSCPVATDRGLLNGSRGLGLKNVKKRLALLYPDRSELQIKEEPGAYTVWMQIGLGEPVYKPVYELV